jgi:integrase/recombinase XerD
MKRLSKQSWEREVDNLVTSFTNVIPSSSNIPSCMGAFFNHIVHNTSFSANTIRIRYVCLSTFTGWLESEININDLKSVDRSILRKYLLYCRDVRGQQGSMLKCSKVALRNFFTFLSDSSVLPSNQAQGIQIPTQMNTRDTAILDAAEILALIDAAKAELKRITSSSSRHINNLRRIFTALRNIAIIYILCSTGIRTEEICLINLADLDLEKGVININGKGNNLYLKRYRPVFVNIPDVMEALKAYIAVRTHTPTRALFCSWDGYPLKSSAIISVVKNIAAEAGIKRNVTPMLVRHTFCSHLTVNGADPFSVRELMGHKKILTTLHYYTHLTRDHIKSQMLRYNPLNKGCDVNADRPGIF